MSEHVAVNRKERRYLMSITKKAMKAGHWGEWEHRFTPENAHISKLPGFANGWCNNLFAVQHFVVGFGGFDRVMVRKHDSSRVNWVDLQRIKNELFGEDRMAFEMLPRQKDLVDSANMYWFFLIPTEREHHFDMYTNNQGYAFSDKCVSKLARSEL